jgi:putative transposase
MGISRSTFYDTPDARARDLAIVAEMKTICDEFEAYGYRRVDAELRHRGIVVNAKKIRRLMLEHALNPKQRRRFIATTDSDHNCPIFPVRSAPYGVRNLHRIEQSATSNPSLTSCSVVV